MPRTQGIADRKSGEEAGWTRVAALSKSECGISIAPPARNTAVRQSICVTELVEKHVLPHAAFPTLVMQSRAQAWRLATRYEEGKLSATQYQLQSRSRLLKYREDWLIKAATQKITPEATRVVKL